MFSGGYRIERDQWAKDKCFRQKETTLRKKCPYSELFWSERGKIRTRITPNTDTFYAVSVN